MTLSKKRIGSTNTLDLDVCRRGSYQIHEPTMIAVFRPNISDRIPENRAASHDPPAIEAVMPPWTLDLGPVQSACVAGVGPWLK